MQQLPTQFARSLACLCLSWSFLSWGNEGPTHNMIFLVWEVSSLRVLEELRVEFRANPDLPVRFWWLQLPKHTAETGRQARLRNKSNCCFLPYLASTSSQLISAKNACCFISSASPFPDPSRFAGFLYKSYEEKVSNKLPASRSFITAFNNERASVDKYEGIFSGAFSMF